MGARSDTWMPLYISKYERATSRLSLAEDGAYGRLIRDYWVNGPPPNDDATIARILRVDRREWLKVRPALEQFFDIRDGQWFHDTVERELGRANDIIEKRREAGRQGGRPPKQDGSKPKPNGSSDAKQNETPADVARPSPLTPPDGGEDANASSAATKPKRIRAKAKAPDGLAQRLWAMQPITGGKRKATSPDVAAALAGALDRGGLPDEIEAAFRAHYALPACKKDEGRYATGAAVLLTNDRWRDFLPAGSAAPAPPPFPDAEIRQAILDSGRDEAWCVSWLDPCVWDALNRTVTPRTNFAAGKIRQDVGSILRELRVRLEERAAA